MLRLLTLALVVLFATDCRKKAAQPGTHEAVATETHRASPPGTSAVLGSIPGDSKVIKYVRPVYPAWARKQHLEGLVELAATISKDGHLREMRVVRGPRDLVPYAQNAVRQWRYKPLRLNGTPVDVRTDILIDFTLNQ